MEKRPAEVVGEGLNCAEESNLSDALLVRLPTFALLATFAKHTLVS